MIEREGYGLSAAERGTRLPMDVLVVIAVFLIAFVGVAIAVYSRRGSDISEHPLGQEAAGDAPGAAGRSEISGHDAGEATTFDQHGTR